MKYLPALACCFFVPGLHAQTCDCEKEFEFVRSYMESNHPGLNSGTKNTAEYKKGVKSLSAEIKKVKPGADCNLYLDEYLSLVKDHHVYIRPVIPQVKKPDISTQAALDSFYSSDAYRSTPKRVIDTAKIIDMLAAKKDNGIEGLYKDGNGNLIAFIKEPGEKWSYKGITVRSVSKLFPVGTVRYEIQERSSGKYWATVLLADHRTRVYATVKPSAEGLPFIGLKRFSNNSQDLAELPYEFKMLDDSTAYLRISSFDGKYYSELQSFYDSIDSRLRSTPYLVIDVRGNGGGSEGNYAALKKYICSGPVRYGSSEIWVSPGNTSRYEEYLAMQKQEAGKYSPQSIERVEKLIAMMKVAAPFTFITYGDETVVDPDTVLPYPAKVAVLVDEGCGSAAEGFIAFAQQSSKVITMGENSGGYVGFGDVLETKTPCGYTLGCTVLRFSGFYKYEFIGIPPMVKLSPGTDWVKEAREKFRGK